MIETRCPHCLTRINSHDSVDDPSISPNPGDVAICWRCRQVSVFHESGGLIRASPQQEDELRDDPGLQRARQAFAKQPLDVHAAIDLARKLGAS